MDVRRSRVADPHTSKPAGQRSGSATHGPQTLAACRQAPALAPNSPRSRRRLASPAALPGSARHPAHTSCVSPRRLASWAGVAAHAWCDGTSWRLCRSDLLLWPGTRGRVSACRRGSTTSASASPSGTARARVLTKGPVSASIETCAGRALRESASRCGPACASGEKAQRLAVRAESPSPPRPASAVAEVEVDPALADGEPLYGV